MRSRALILSAMLILAPLGARGADLVVWWEEGQYAEEDEAVREIITAVEEKTGAAVGSDRIHLRASWAHRS